MGKYGGDKDIRNGYDTWLGLALPTEGISKIHESGYYGNNLLSMVWFLISYFERRDPTAKHWSKLESKMGKLCSDYAIHFQAQLPAYWITASGAAGQLFGNIV